MIRLTSVLGLCGPIPNHNNGSALYLRMYSLKSGKVWYFLRLSGFWTICGTGLLSLVRAAEPTVQSAVPLHFFKCSSWSWKYDFSSSVKIFTLFHCSNGSENVVFNILVIQRKCMFWSEAMGIVMSEHKSPWLYGSLTVYTRLERAVDLRKALFRQGHFKLNNIRKIGSGESKIV